MAHVRLEADINAHKIIEFVEREHIVRDAASPVNEKDSGQVLPVSLLHHPAHCRLSSRPPEGEEARELAASESPEIVLVRNTRLVLVLHTSLALVHILAFAGLSIATPCQFIIQIRLSTILDTVLI
jgi:hypothetical protein